jgi:PAS domain S-box-containing protein
MTKPFSWARTLNAKLGVLAALLVALMIGLVVMNHYVLSAQRAAGRRALLSNHFHLYRLLYFAEQILHSNADARVQAQAALKEAVKETDQRFAALLNGDSARGIPATTDPDVLALLNENEQRWTNSLKQVFERLASEPAPKATAAEMASLQGRVEALVVSARRRTDLEDKSFAQGLSRLEMIQVIWFVLPVVVLVVALGVVRGGIRRIRSLARTAEQIAAGDLSLKAGVRGSDEIAGLGAAFDAMIATMKANIHKESDEKTRAQAVIDSTADGILTMNETGTILLINAVAEKLFGYEGEKVLGRNASLLVPALYQEDSQSYENRDIRAGEARQIADESVVSGIRRDGSKFPMALRVTEMRYRGEKHFIATFQNITQRRRAEEERNRIFAAIREAVNKLASASAQILTSTTQQAAGAQEQAAAVSQTVTTVDEVTQTSAQAAQRAKNVGEIAQQNLDIGKAGRKAVEDSIAAMNNLKSQVEATAENILMLAEQAQAIGEIIATATDIAEQSNLLALNAAIEASRAGEHGKGFSVVASEVKALADQSKKATTQVRQILGQIQKATNTAVVSTEAVTRGVASAIQVGGQTGDTINTLVDTLTHTAQAAAQIVASASQQATGMAQIHQAMKNLDQVAKQNLVATRQVEQAAQNLNALGTQLAELSAA